MSDLAQRMASLSPAQRRLLEQRMLEKRIAGQKSRAEPIAIIGMSCRFAGARNLAEYWQVIRQGIDAISEVPPSRWDLDELYDPTGTQSGKMFTKWGGFIDGIDQFDPQFFGITPREAARMDPQQRLLLEVSWEVMENAGRPADQMAGSKTAVYVGIGSTDYSKVPSQLADYYHHIDAHVGTGNALSIAANRISYVYDFHGPSAAVDTACSSASLAVHLGVESLRRKECSAALVGGVNAIITPETTIAFSKARMLSPEGKLRPFDAGANGYVRGEGCGMLFLKRLADAEKDGDQVLAIIRATSVNQDGRTSGISAPNGRSQQECIRAAMAQAGVTPADISYIEAHGTGTQLGDPIEMQALTELFPKGEGAESPLYVTSVKANIGHTETAAGVAGLIKTLLLMQHEQIAPQLHFRSLNPHISLEGSRIVLPTETIPWPSSKGRRLAGVSSYGFGGTNTHLLIEAPAQVASVPRSPAAPLVSEQNGDFDSLDPTTTQHHVLKLTGRSSAAVEERAAALATFLSENGDAEVADVCFSANTSQADFNHRAAVVGDSVEGLAQSLAQLAAGKKGPTLQRGQVQGIARPKVAMLFTGQGSQYPQMGRALYQTEPVFREAIDQCDTLLRKGSAESLLSILFPKTDEQAELIHKTLYTQPALFAIEYATARLWQSWGVEPSLLLGHSIGEYVAATIAGCMTLEEGLLLLAERARLMQQISKPGKMAVLFAPEAKVAPKLAGKSEKVAIAALNGPENTVISGDADEIDRLVQEFESDGIGVQPLTVSHAFHSPHMDEMLDAFEQFASKIEFQPPKIGLISNRTGQLMKEAPTARYWRDHVRGSVRFREGVERLAEAKMAILLEVGPSATLLGMARRCVPDFEVASIASLRKGQEADQTMASAVSQLYVAGGKLDWRSRHRHAPRKRLLLPNYPFHRNRYWFDVDKSVGRSGSRRTGVGHPLLGCRVPSVWTSKVYETVIDAHAPPFLSDHQVQGSVVVPGSAFLEQGLAAARETFGEGCHALQEVSVQAALFLSEEGARLVQVAVEPEAGGRSEMESYSSPADADEPTWSLHATASLVHESQLRSDAAPQPIDLAALRSRVNDRKTREEFYQIIADRGLVYGPQFQVLGGVERTPTEALSTIEAHELVTADLGKYQLHPVLGDACLQTLASTVPLEEDGSYSPYTYMPVAFRQVKVLKRIEDLDEPVYCYAIRRSEASGPSPETVQSDVYLVDGAGNVLVEMLGVQVQRIGRGTAGTTSRKPADWLYRVGWKESPLSGSGQGRLDDGTWLIFADQQGTGEALAARLTAENRAVLLVRPGKEFRLQSGVAAGTLATATFDPADEQQLGELLAKVSTKKAPLAGIVHLWSLDIEEPTTRSQAEGAWRESSRLGVGSALLTIKQLARCGQATMPRLWLVTAGAQATEENAATAVLQSPMVGLARVATIEQTELRPTHVDLAIDSECDRRADQLFAELGAIDPTDRQIAYRDGRRIVARLEPDTSLREAIANDPAVEGATGGSVFQLRITNTGSFDALKYLPVERKVPGPGEIEIAVEATGLNFSDVLKALGLYPGIKDEIVPLGIEASGVVTAVGEGVERFQVGDEVMGVAPYAFASHANTRDYMVVPKPKSITHDEACTIPITFLTAYYGLVQLAQTGRGERVLIHAGAGGVGLAAIQICQHLGAEVFATAGSDEKRDFLRSLGVEHVYNSRTLDFAEEILADTNREGIDVVLNSLPGEAITKSLSILRAHGRFLEIGKIDIYQNRKLGLLPFQDNLSYHAIDLDRILRDRPEMVRGLYDKVMQHFEAGDYKPALHTRFRRDQTIDAFRYMSQRKNIGKVVVAIGAATGGPASADRELPPKNALSMVRADGAYLITGGLGALGQQVAHWLADQGASTLVLMSRSKPSEEQLQNLEPLRAQGVRIIFLRSDVVDAVRLERGLAKLPDDLPPLRGVIHAAGVLADGVLADMSLDQLDKAMLPKTLGAWNLHEATKDSPLDFFLLFSSVAAILGSPGQGNYAAGNAALDALAHRRRSDGLPATSINWGPWAGSGMAADTLNDPTLNDDPSAGIRSRGMDLLPAKEGLKLLGPLLDARVTQTTVMDVYWDDLLRLLGNRRPSLLADIAAERGEAGDGGSQVDRAFLDQLHDSGPDERVALVRDYIQAELARIMSFEPDQLAVDQPLTTFGLDSLMALELKNNLEARLAFTLPMAKLLEGPSIASLAVDTVELLSGEEATAASKTPEVWNPLIKLRDGSAAEPLILLPALAGDVSCYAELVKHLSVDRPVMAFRPRGMDDASRPHADMQKLTTDYARALREIQPKGPYYLAAWSAGGVGAFALAEHLIHSGEQIGLLALFDAPLPSIYRDVDVDDEVQFLCDMIRFTNRVAGIQIDVSLEKLSQLAPEERFADTLRQAREQGMFPPGVQDEYVHRLVAVGVGLILASKGYQPKPLDIEMQLFLPTLQGGLEDISGHKIPEGNGWENRVGQKTLYTTIPGDHFTMMTGEGAKEMAAVLDQLLS